MERIEDRRKLECVDTGCIPLTSVAKVNSEQEKKIWYLGETVKKLYDLDNNPARKSFLDDYFAFMKRRGSSVTKVPVVAKLPLDLFRLFCVVQALGGFAQVVKKRRWSRVVRELDLPSSITSAAFTLRTQYMRLLYPYECEKKGIPVNFMYNNRSPNKHGSNDMEFHRYQNGDSHPCIGYKQQTEQPLSPLSDDDICSQAKHTSMMASGELQRPKSEELDREKISESIELPDRPRSFDHYKKLGIFSGNNYINEELNRCIRSRKNSVDRDKSYFKTSSVDFDHDVTEKYFPHKQYVSMDNDYYPREKKSINQYDRKHYSYDNTYYELQGRNSSPGLPENARFHPYHHNLPNGDIIGYHNDAIYQHSSGKQHESRDHLNDKRDFFHNMNSSYRQPFKYTRLSTNPSEMKITIEERTETAMALSVVVNGICYTGTLLSTSPRL